LGGAELSLADVASMAGVRNIVFSLMVAYAAFALPKAAVALLVAGRGLTDLADGLLGIASAGVSGQVIMPIVLAVISFVVAYLITKLPGERLFGGGDTTASEA
jgi:hypothetical protein